MVIRWLFAFWAVVLAFLYSYLTPLLTVFGLLPKDLAEPTTAFVMGASTVLSGALIAPTHRLATGLILACAGILVAMLGGFNFVGLILGQVLALSIMVWRSRSDRSKLKKRKAVLIASTSLALFLTLVCARFVDFPAVADPLPEDLADSLGADARRVTAFYDFNLGGFIDTQHLGRIDAPSDVIAKLIADLELERTPTVPGIFWKMPPRYWPRSLPSGAVAFQTEGFTADERGSDGEYYFLLHDQASNRAFFWRKSNF
jgi:hypothetical protein